MFPGPSEYDVKMCYDNIVKGIVDDDVNKVIDILERNADEIKRIMTNFKLYYLFYTTKSKEMLIILLDYFDVKNIFDITNLLPSIITAAIRLGMDIKMIQRLIERGGNINDTDVTHVSPLLQSIKSKRDVNFVEEILEMGANVNEIFYDSNSILDIAVSNFCSGDDIKIIQLLIDSGADINAKNSYFGALLKLPLNADEDLWLELTNGKLAIDPHTVKYSLSNTFLINVVFKISRLKQFLDVLNYNQITTDTMNEACNRLLHLALNINCGADCILEIIHNGANINEMKYNNSYKNECNKPLLVALKLNRDKEIISALIDNGADVNAIDEHRLTPLFYAINNNYTIEIINKLINLGADVNKCDFDRVTPLMWAIKINNNEIISTLINTGADVNAVDIFGRTILCYAVIYCNDQNVISLLIEKGADFKGINDRYDQFWFSIEVGKKSDDKFITEIIQNGNDFNMKDIYGRTFLMYAIELNMNKNIIFSIICNRANINATDNKGYSPLIYAIKCECDINVIIKLIEHGADCNVIDNNGLTPLKHAVHSPMFKEIIEILLDNGVNINTHNKNNNTLLLYLLKYVNYNKELVSFVVEKGADVNICDNNGLTPIMYAVLYGEESIKIEIISTLIENGAHVDAVDKNGHTALCYAFFLRGRDNEEILVLLLDNGASVYKYLSNLSKHETPLIYSLNYNRNVKIIIELLHWKEDINENDKDRTSFLSKLYSSHLKLAFLLISDHNDLVKKDKKLIFNIFTRPLENYVEKILFCSDLDIKSLVDVHRKLLLHFVLDENKRVRITKTILEKCGYAKSVDSKLNTPLHFTFFPELINVFIIYGNADVTARNKKGEITCHNVFLRGFDSGYYHDTTTSFIKHLLLVLPEELHRYPKVKYINTYFIKACNAELNEMQSINIVDNLSFFRFCCKLSEYEMNLISESDNFCVYNDRQIKKMFPIYYDIIIMKIKKCKIDLSKRQLINALACLVISNRIIKSYDPKNYEVDLSNCSVEHSEQLSEIVLLNHDILYCISKYLYDRNVINLLLASL